jgi:uncharacterized membrane protein YbhN (UPF0104 family)
MSSPIQESILGRSTLGRWLLGLALLLGLVAWVQRAVGWAELLAPWRTLAAGQLMLLLALTALSYFLRAVRIYDYSRHLLQGAFPATLRLSLLHNALNNFLPMRLGELAYPILMKRYFGQGYTASSVTLLWIRLLDLHFLGLPALLFLYVRQGAIGWLVLIPPWMALIPALYWGHNRLHRRVLGYDGRWAVFINKVLGHVPNSAIQFFRIWIWTALSWICKLMAFTAVVLHFADIDLGRAVLGTLGAELSSVLPVNGVAGAGTYELAMSAVLLPLGLEVATVLKAAVNLHLYLLGSSLLLALWGLLLPRPHPLLAQRGGQSISQRVQS